MQMQSVFQSVLYPKGAYTAQGSYEYTARRIRPTYDTFVDASGSSFVPACTNTTPVALPPFIDASSFIGRLVSGDSSTLSAVEKQWNSKSGTYLTGSGPVKKAVPRSHATYAATLRGEVRTRLDNLARASKLDGKPSSEKEGILTDFLLLQYCYQVAKNNKTAVDLSGNFAGFKSYASNCVLSAAVSAAQADKMNKWYKLSPSGFTFATNTVPAVGTVCSTAYADASKSDDWATCMSVALEKEGYIYTTARRNVGYNTVPASGGKTKKVPVAEFVDYQKPLIDVLKSCCKAA